MLHIREELKWYANNLQEETKKSLKKKRKGRHSDPARIEDVREDSPDKLTKAKKKKRVSFG